MVADNAVNFSINISLQCSIENAKFNARRYRPDFLLDLCLSHIVAFSSLWIFHLMHSSVAFPYCKNIKLAKKFGNGKKTEKSIQPWTTCLK